MSGYIMIICKFQLRVKWVQNITLYVRNTHFTLKIGYAKLNVR